MDIRENDFRGVDLNLLVTFLVLMREGSVSRAAERLHLGQPAVSGALSRLRELFADPLLVRTRSGMQPTARAIELQNSLGPVMQSIHAVVFETPEFDAASSDRTFVLGMPDWVELWLAPLLFAELRRQAPLMRLSIVNTDPFRVVEMLERGEMDIAISPVHPIPSWCRHRLLRATGFSCVYKVPGKRARTLSLQDYLKRTHLLVSYRSAFESAADDWLSRHGMTRKVALSTTRFAALPSLLQENMTIATVPRPIALHWRENPGLLVSDCPVPLPAIDVSSVWLAARDTEKPLQWLIGLLASIAAL